MVGGAHVAYDDAGYRLEVPPGSLDLDRFEVLVDRGRALLEGGPPEEARAALQEAEALWRGDPLADLADHEPAVAVATRLAEQRLTAVEDRIAADLALGRHASAAGELAALVAAHPLREGLQAKLALALYRSGRQADALRALAEAGRTLREELGIEPSRQLRDLEAAILAHDPTLDGQPAVPRSPGGVAAPVPAPAVPSDLVGRDAELAELLAALDEAAADARFVVVEGEPGIGKTRLLEELRLRAVDRGCLAVWGRSDEGGAAPALWPWLPMLRALAAGPVDVPSGLAELVAGEAPLLAGQGAAVQFERFDALAGLLERTGASAPVVVLLDDLQWADATSAELLGFLAGRLGAGVLVAATMRQLEVGRRDAVTEALAAVARRRGSRRLRLRGLTSAATAEMLQAAGARDVPASVSATIHQRAEGNPFYAIELARLVDAEGSLDSDVPATVGDVIRRRLAHLPDATVDLLGAAAVTGREFDLGLLARSVGMALGDCLDGVEPAVVQRLLVDVAEQPGVLRFSHALVREVLLDGLTPLRRARLHLRVADAIEEAGAGLDDAEILAEHLWQAAPVGVGRRAAEALERAAEVAVSRVSYQTAEHLLLRAIRLRRAAGSADHDQRAELAAAVRLLEVTQATRYFQGADREVVIRAQHLADRLGLAELRRRLFWYEWSALATAARVDEAAPLAEAYAAQVADAEVPLDRASGHRVYGTALWGRGRITEAVGSFELALALLEDLDPPVDAIDAEERLTIHTFAAMTHALHGDRDEGETAAAFDAVIAASPPAATATVCGFAATTAASLGWWRSVERYVRQGMGDAAALPNDFWGGQLRMLDGALRVRAGAVDDGIGAHDEGRSRYVGAGARSGLATFEATMAIALAGAGDAERAAGFAAAGRSEVDTWHERWNEPVVLVAEALAAHAAGDVAGAAGRLRGAVELADAQGAHGVARRAVALAAELGLTPAPPSPTG